MEKTVFLAISFNGRSVWVRLEADGVRSGTIGSLPIFIGRLPKAKEQHRKPCRVVSYCRHDANDIS